ncbi:BrxE family protein [Natronococcus wangiae]|uniref:BrxE family protein n=1 Tax=Natronococcus wangiae TaxID=3068275 RepID=UPI00273CFD25|nr:BrxE family protein [Natronococcus sp. AD5]
MTSADLVDAFISTKETLYETGIEDDFFLDLIAARLVVERVGEANNRDWWDSRVLSETGRARLSEVTPKTQLQSRIKLASKVGRKAESDRLSADAISLFSFGPRVESRVKAAIEEIESADKCSLGTLENLSVQSLDEGWTDQLIEQTASNSTAAAGSRTEPAAGRSFRLDDSEYTQSEIEAEKRRLLTTLLQGYGYSTDRLRVPYYPLAPELKSENA